MADQTHTPIKRPPSRLRWRKAFLAALGKTGVVVHAATAAKIERKEAYRLREKDPKFAQEWAEALEAATDVLEAEAVRRAVTGVKKPVYQGGERVGYVQEYSDTLLIFLLKGAKPDKYRERFDVRAGSLPDAGSAIAAALDQVRGARKELPAVEILKDEKEDEP